MSEIVVCQLPFGTPHERDALLRMKDIGVTAIQIYVQWRLFENAGRGKHDFAALDREVGAIQDAGLKFVPFLLMGPFYAATDWLLASNEHVGLRCLEHDKVCPIESIWNAAFHREVERVTHDFARHYLPWNVIESVQPGICGDYGEAIFPVLGNWPGTYHTHRGYWCGGSDARASFRAYLKHQYASLDALNRRWRTSHGSFDDIHPQLPHKCPSRSALFDQITWYRQSMTDYAGVWMKACRDAFPDTPIYLCTGGADDETQTGAHFAQQAKIAAKYKGGIRLTNEANAFSYNYPLTSHTHAACEQYGAYLGLEPVGPMTEQGVRNRLFGSAAMGNRQIFYYYNNFIDPRTHEPKPAAGALKQYLQLIREQPSERGIAMFWPIDQATLDGCVTGQPGLATSSTALLHVRRQYPVSAVSEELILDGALSRYRCLAMIGVHSTRRDVLKRIASWVKNDGGILLTTTRTADIEHERVDAFDELLGFTPDSEDAWGHHQEQLHLPAEFKRMGELSSIHSDHGWLHLAEGTEKLGVGKPGIGSSGIEGLTFVHPVSALFRRTYPSGGQAIYYGGAICFKPDPQAIFRDPAIIARLLDDVCALTGIAPLGTQDDEFARARIGGQLLVLREDRIDVSPL